MGDLSKKAQEKFLWKDWGRVAVYIDNANLIHSASDLGWFLNFQKFLNFFRKNAKKFVEIRFYDAVDKNNKKQAGFQSKIERMGYQLVIKDLKFIKSQDGRFIKKGDCDVDLVVDAIRMRRRYDTLILVSGDSDFTALVKYLKKDCKKGVVVISTRGHISRELIDASEGNYIPLGLLKNRCKLRDYRKIDPQKSRKAR